MAKHSFDYDLIVIGSGAGGSVAAMLAARKGKRVAIIEADALGGDAPNFGDVPMNALLHAARIYGEAKAGQQFGIRSNTIGYNYPSVKAWKDLAVSRAGAGGSQRFYEAEGITVFEGTAHFISPHEITVNRRHISAAYFIIATGTHWMTPQIVGLDKLLHLTPRTAMELIRPPKSIFIIGGGATGVEFAHLFSTFGSKVYIADVAPRLLLKEDDEVSELIERVFDTQKGVTTLTSTRVVKVARDGIMKRVTYLRGDAEHSVKVDEILIAAGKDPNVDIGLENAGVAYTPKGVEVNEYLQTSVKHIYAAGDVLGTHMFTHVALLESRVAAHNLLHRDKVTPNYKAVPRVTHTVPEIASVGLSEDDCIKRDLAINKATVPINIIGRANTTNTRDGFVKIITDKKGVILGATIAAPSAGELIHELTLAIQHGLTAQDVALTMHAFPTWSEAIRVACSKL
ncbi:MAG TPA: NAD(P)/FAD-dependent oxidoreductase [Verrucomicrobiae bacterium]|nr:NAD(P)/FAD-dependent oxidoreductase [Verrucomicrobiae bacterium]